LLLAPNLGRCAAVSPDNISQRVLSLKWQRPEEFGCRPLILPSLPCSRGAASVYDLIEDEIASMRQVKVKYPLFGKAFSDLFGILPEIGDRMNNNPV
jgi:hypothetical protein